MTSVWVPLVFILIYTYIIAELFIGFFHQAVTATLMCLAVDLELNGSIQHGSPSFHEKIDSAFNKHGGDAVQPEIMIQTNQTANTYQQVPQGGHVNQTQTMNYTQNSMV